MEVNEQNLAQLRALFLQTLMPDNNARKEAEKFLESSEVQPGFSLVVLHMISILSASTNPQDVAIRQSASVLFKNMVKKRWCPEDDEEPRIPVGDRTTIKQHLVDLMCTTPPDVQRQLAEAVSIVSKYDFPEEWQNLLPILVSKLAANDITVTKGVMLTANSIMKRFRYVYKSDELFSEILFCLKGFQAPLLETYTNNGMVIEALAADKAKLSIALETQRLMTRIFFSLNWQDLPEFFEENIRSWMAEFGKWLVYKNPVVVDASEESEPGPIEKLQAAIVENLNLYATKYEEEFAPYLPEFTKVIWQLLLGVGAEPKYDILATSAIKFLTTVSSKHANIGLFTDDILREIIEHIVVRNLTATENDEELFEDNPTDYIRKDMEGSDQDTRRRSACELVRGLLKFFNAKTSQLCVAYIGAMLEQYRTSMDWRAKDAALHLVLAVAVMSTSANLGAGELNPNVNILEIFNSHVLSEIHDTNVNARPIVKADAIKMICIFRSHLQAPFMLSLLPDIIRHLNSKYVVIQTYAALCIERFLTVKDRDAATNQMTPRVTKEHLMEYLQPLFSGLFAVLENRDLPENDYVMKCIMRVLSLVGTDIAPVTELVLNHLTQALERVCRNPANPHFNHYLFECLALLVRSACNVPSADQALAACTKFEALLFPPFQAVLSQDVVEFVPYVFQILAQLLSARPGAQCGLSPAYLALFPPLLSPALWERKGNIPALTDLYRAYISKGMKEILAGNYLTGVLGVFQKLLASKVSMMISCISSLITCYLHHYT
jgi:exportin-2 (importin alpha re-exporter)